MMTIQQFRELVQERKDKKVPQPEFVYLTEQTVCDLGECRRMADENLYFRGLVRVIVLPEADIEVLAPKLRAAFREGLVETEEKPPEPTEDEVTRRFKEKERLYG